MKKYFLVLVAILGFAFSAQANDVTPRIDALEASADIANATLQAEGNAIAYEFASGLYNTTEMSKKCWFGPCCDSPKPAEGCVCVIDWTFQVVGNTIIYIEWAYWSCPTGNQ